mmetsp:Transcript_45952/g.80742  ORF Transcript_45952/g.80742 Transcript_45952/m.80742 type:complete len:646 (-) Transcript_45952:194-2131(-)
MEAPAGTNYFGMFTGKCWSGAFTFRRCCMMRDPNCWGGEFTYEACCYAANQTVSWWHGGPAVKSWAHVVMWFLSTRSSCYPGMSLSLEDCCSYGTEAGPSAGHVSGVSCWDGVFSRSKCCGHKRPQVLSTEAGNTCWAGGYTFERCCQNSYGSTCWDSGGVYTYDKCCIQQALPSNALNLSALFLQASRRGRCKDPRHIGKCEQLWRSGLSNSRSRVDRQLVDAALHLVQRWGGHARVSAVAATAPAFAVSVSLYGAIGLIDRWMDQSVMPVDLWTQVQGLLKLHRALLPKIAEPELSPLHIPFLDEEVQRRVHQTYQDALQGALIERITHAGQGSLDFGDRTSDSFLTAFRELVEVLLEAKIDFIPIQGTLIALLRYGSFPAGRLSHGKEDVVDNDAEVAIILGKETDFHSVTVQISLGLEARGWPACTNPHPRKLVCLSMRHHIPCKLEIYAFAKDDYEHVIFSTRTCSANQCEYYSTFPLQHWDGRMPAELIYPMQKCRIGDLKWSVPCPNMPLAFLRGWNRGEYEKQSQVPRLPDHLSRRKEKNSEIAAASTSSSSSSSNCLALPVISKDRDMGDERNQHLEREGLNMEDLRLLHNHARELHARGFVSFHDHLKDPPCIRRAWGIFYGETHFGMSKRSGTS